MGTNEPLPLFERGTGAGDGGIRMSREAFGLGSWLESEVLRALTFWGTSEKPPSPIPFPLWKRGRGAR